MLQLFLQLLTGKKIILPCAIKKKKIPTSASCIENEINNETFDIKLCHVTCHSNSQTGSDAFTWWLLLTVTCNTVSGGQSIVISLICIHCENKNTNFMAITLCTCWWTPGISLRIDRSGLWRIPLLRHVSRSLPLSQSVFSLRILSECLSLPKSKFLVLDSLLEI